MCSRARLPEGAKTSRLGKGVLYVYVNNNFCGAISLYKLSWCHPFLLTAAVLDLVSVSVNCRGTYQNSLPPRSFLTYVLYNLVRNGAKVARTYDVGASELSNHGTTIQPL